MSSRSAGVPNTVGRTGRSPDNPTMLPSSLMADPDAESGHVARTTRDWIVDVVCFLLAVGASVLVYLVLNLQHRLMPMPWLALDVAIAALGCVALWWRRRWPVTLAVAMGLAGAVFGLGLGPSIVALFTVAVHRRATIAIAVTGLHAMSALPYSLLHPDPGAPYWAAVGWTVLATAVIATWGMTVRARRQLVLSLRDRAQRAEAEQQLRAEQARRAERTRIAREMHDVLAHRISLLSTYAGALEFRKDASPDEVTRAAGVMRSSAHQALQDLREVIGVLREDGNSDDPERPQPTIADLPGLIGESRRAGMRVGWENRVDDLSEVPAGPGRNAYRIVQEGLTNVRKHARDTTASVVVEGAAGTGLTVEIRNRIPVGQAESAIPGAGSGLVGLTERANLAGGALAHGRTPDGDFRLRAWLPWPG